MAVTSNSHKAINNLLHGVEHVTTERGLSFKGAKKSTSDEDKPPGADSTDAAPGDAAPAKAAEEAAAAGSPAKAEEANAAAGSKRAREDDAAAGDGEEKQAKTDAEAAA